jgi:hypothetical protein
MSVYVQRIHGESDAEEQWFRYPAPSRNLPGDAGATLEDRTGFLFSTFEGGVPP